MMNAQELINDVNDMCSEPSDGTGRWNDAILITKMNQNQDEVTLRVTDLIRSAPTAITVTLGTQLVTLPASIGKVYQVFIDNKSIGPVSDNSLNNSALAGDIPNPWVTTTGIPESYFIRNNQIGLYPIPAANCVLTLVGELLLTQLTDSASSYPFENIPYLRKGQKIISLLTAADCVLIDGDQAQADIYRNQGYTLLNELATDWSTLRTPQENTSVVVEQIQEGGGL